MSSTLRGRALRSGLVAVATTAVLTGSFMAFTSTTDQVSRAAAAESASTQVKNAMLGSGNKLAAGQEIKSLNGKYTLRMQTDGNFVLLDGGKVIWHAGTAPSPGAAAHMQRDGNLTVRAAGTNKPLWDTGTQGRSATLHVQNDGNVTVRTPDGKVLWALSDEVSDGARLNAGEALRAGEERHSLNGKYTLRMQTDGNLVLVDDSDKVLWHAGTAPNRSASAHMQRDGNLTVRAAGTNKPLWDTGTQGQSATLHVQNDGNVTIRTPDGKVLWARP
jgi:hypothetical protein